MKVVGDGFIHLYESEDEKPHVPDDDVDWQESSVLFFWDQAQDIYGFFRVGKEPNKQPAVAVNWINIWVRGKYYKNYCTPALLPEHCIDDGFIGGDILTYRYDGNHHWTVNDGDVSAELVMEDFHQGFGFIGESAGALSTEVAPDHIEASGVVYGKVTLGGETYQISNAIGLRDRSWGKRAWENIRAHRWTPAIFGPDLSFLALSWFSPDGGIAKVGYVVRDDEIIVPSEIEIQTFCTEDGLTHTGALSRLTMPDGKIYEAKFEALAPGGMSAHYGYPCVDTMCKVTMDGRVGVGCVEAGNNTLGGQESPIDAALVMGHVANGIFDY